MHPSELYQASPPRVQVLSVPQSSCTGVPQGAYTDCSQQGLLGTTWVPAAKQVNKNKHKSINMAQSAKRRTPDGHMIRPDMTVGSTEEKTNPRKSEMQGPPSAQGSQGLRRHTARLAWPWLPQRDTHALVPAHPHSHPEQRQHTLELLVMSPKPKPGTAPDSHSIKQLWANSLWASCRRAACLSSQ